MSDSQIDAALGRPDGCPGCVSNVELPAFWWLLESGAWRGQYICSSCDHQWQTDWRNC